MLILVMVFNGIAFWQLWDEKGIVTAGLYKKFLKTYVGIQLTGEGCKGSGVLHDNVHPKKAHVVTKFLTKNNFEI